ncbi:MAG: gamma carbonic anhydrase family protein [Candidatus Omnitrophica bacterium]|nr:gamma carbonic anhydrase family protein [Candidatus Omnitrophota bacterium]
MIIPFKGKAPVIDAAYVAPSATVIGRVRIGRHASVWPGAVIRADIAPVRIGEGTNVQDLCMIHVDVERPCVVGKHVTLGHQCTLHGCRVGDTALIGIGARILTGASVGKNSIIGAGSVVLENARIPSGVLAVGTPAKVIRKLTRREMAALARSAAEYVKLSQEYRRQNLLFCPSEMKFVTDLKDLFG